MSKVKILTVFLWLLVILLGIPKTYASPTISAPGDLSFTEEKELNLISFEVTVNESGYYYTEFWLMPAKYMDGGYTRFSIFANGEFIGNIIPDRDNWQAARLDGNERIFLNKGVNMITVGVPSPEMPAVEVIKVSLTDTEAIIPSKAYERFYSDISTGKKYEFPMQQTCETHINETIQASNAPEVSYKHFSDVPLIYTFHVQFKFKENDEVHIATSGEPEHDVDILYIGQKHDSQFSNSDEEANNSYVPTTNVSVSMDSESTTTETSPSPVGVNRKYKLTQAYDLASSEELQGLNWKCISIPTKAWNPLYAHSISKIIKIPKTGVYLIRIRHREPGKTGKVSLSVNNRYAYGYVPISFTWLPCELPANGNEYGTIVKSSNPDMDDPMLFIHGAAADRVVGLGDDASLRSQEVHDLAPYDSHIHQQYNVRTSGISVCNYFSNTPASTCQVIAGIDESYCDLDSGFELKPKSTESNDQLAVIPKSRKVGFSDCQHVSGTVTINSQSPITRVTVSNIHGIIIGIFQHPGTEFSFSKKDLNVPNAGIYIVTIETTNESISKKIFLD